MSDLIPLPDPSLDAISSEIFSQISKELTGESDRACAVVAGALLDDFLQKLLEAYLIEHSDASKSLFGSDSDPLGSFGPRITMSYAVGLLNKYEYEGLKKIQKIRNRFAHRLALTFDDTSISDICRVLGSYPPIEDLLKTSPGGFHPRNTFIVAVSFFAGVLDADITFNQAQEIRGNYSAVLKRAYPKDSGSSEP